MKKIFYGLLLSSIFAFDIHGVLASKLTPEVSKNGDGVNLGRPLTIKNKKQFQGKVKQGNIKVTDINKSDNHSSPAINVDGNKQKVTHQESRIQTQCRAEVIENPNVVLSRVLSGKVIGLNLKQSEYLASYLLNMGVTSIKTYFYALFVDVKVADKEYAEILKLLGLFIKAASLQASEEAASVLVQIFKRIDALSSPAFAIRFIAGLGDINKSFISHEALVYMHKFNEKLEELKKLDEIIFIKGSIIHITEEQEKGLSSELMGLFMEDARELLRKDKVKEDDIKIVLKLLRREIRMLVLYVAIGHYEKAKESLNRFYKICKAHRIERFGKVCVSHIKSFPGIIKNLNIARF